MSLHIKAQVQYIAQKTEIKFSFGCQRIAVVMSQINFWHEQTQLSLILMIYESNLSSV